MNTPGGSGKDKRPRLYLIAISQEVTADTRTVFERSLRASLALGDNRIGSSIDQSQQCVSSSSLITRKKP